MSDFPRYVPLDFYPAQRMVMSGHGMHLLSETAKLPERATPRAAAYDAYADIAGRMLEFRSPKNQPYLLPAQQVFAGQPESDWIITIPPGHRCLVPLGFAMSMPDTFVAYLHARSGVAWKQDVVLGNATGVIDADYAYPNEWKAMLKNESQEAFTLTGGERACQIVFHRFREIGGLPVRDAERTGGFGSTGK